MNVFVDALSDAWSQMTGTLAYVAQAFGENWRTGLAALLARPAALLYVVGIVAVLALVLRGLTAENRVGYRTNDKGEHEELAEIYVDRGLQHALAKKVADQLMAHDALGAHARDELGITPTLEARPIQAALASAASFVIGASMPLIVAALAPQASVLYVVPASSLIVLAALGALAARTGGARMAPGALRVTFWGALAMGVTAGAGALFGTIV